MAFKKLITLKPWGVLGLFLLLWWILPTLFKSFTEVTFFEIQAPIWKANAGLRDLQSYWGYRNHSKQQLIEANRDMARLNATYELTRMENASLREEVERLETQLEIPAHPGYQSVLVRVLRRKLTSWSHQLVIQKGEKEGIIESAAVIYRNGVVGRIKKVFAHTAVVELVSSPTFRIAARFRGDTRPITYRGMSNATFSNPVGSAYNIPNDFQHQIEQEPTLVTSRLGGIFPDGLYIGTICELRSGSDGLFQKAEVSLNRDLHAIQEATVLIPTSSEQT